MNATAPECPACRVRMEEGHVLGMGKSKRLQLVTWTEGAPDKGGLSGYRTKGRRQFESMTWRCPRCGWLLWFAPGEDG